MVGADVLAVRGVPYDGPIVYPESIYALAIRPLTATRAGPSRAPVGQAGVRATAPIIQLRSPLHAPARDPPPRRARRPRRQRELALARRPCDGRSARETRTEIRARAFKPAPAREGDRAADRRPARRDRRWPAARDGRRDRRPDLRRDAHAH